MYNVFMYALHIHPYTPVKNPVRACAGHGSAFDKNQL